VRTEPPTTEHAPTARSDTDNRNTGAGYRPPEKLPGAFRTIDVARHPLQRRLRLLRAAVVDPQPAAGPVLARLGRVRAEFIDHQPDPGDREMRDPLAGLRVRRSVVIGAQERVDELCGLRAYADVPSGGGLGEDASLWNAPRRDLLVARKCAWRPALRWRSGPAVTDAELGGCREACVHGDDVSVEVGVLDEVP